MSCITQCCVLTRGEFYISDFCSGEEACADGGLSDISCGTQNVFRKLGNVSSCVVETQAEVLGRENKFNPVGASCPRIAITGVNLTLSLNCASRENLYRALFASGDQTEAGSNRQEFAIDELVECDFFPYSKQKPEEESVIVTLIDPMGILVKTLVLDTDYRLSKSGVEIINDVDIINSSKLVLEYDFDPLGYYVAQFLSKFQGYKTIFFKGTNYADSTEGIFDATFHKVLFAPVSQFDLITQNDFLTLTLTGTVEPKNGKWYEIIKQEG